MREDVTTLTDDEAYRLLGWHVLDAGVSIDDVPFFGREARFFLMVNHGYRKQPRSPLMPFRKAIAQAWFDAA